MSARLQGLFLALLLGFASLGAGAAGFSLTDTEGKVHRLSDYRGKWLIVNFWATWCPPCLEEIPDLVALKESRKDVQILGVAMEFQDAKQVMQFAEGMFVNYPIVLGGDRASNEVGKVTGLPTTFIYDPRGNLIKRHMGKITRRELERLLEGRAG
jgi:thiol-disulfide isomerase/thioredoxin